MTYHSNSDLVDGSTVEICVGARESESARLQNEDDACYDFTSGALAEEESPGRAI